MRAGRNLDTACAEPRSLHELARRLELGEVFDGDFRDEDLETPDGGYDRVRRRRYSVDPHYREVTEIDRRWLAEVNGKGVPKSPRQPTPKTAPERALAVVEFQRPETTRLRDTPPRLTDADLYGRSVESLGLWRRTEKVLLQIGVVTVGDLVVRLPELWRFRGIGYEGIQQAERAVQRAAHEHTWALRAQSSTGNASTKDRSK